MEESKITEVEFGQFNDSLSRCSANYGFLDCFYELLLGCSEEVRRKFEHTNLQKQRRILMASFHMLMLAADGKPEGQIHLERIAEVHSKAHRDIPPHFYDLWMTCLLQAVKKCDPCFTPDVERVWRRMMEHGIAFMKSKY